MSDPITNEPTTPNSGRQSDGRFAKGNKFGPGNPFARKCAALRAALMSAVTEQDITDIAVKLRDDAKAGDKAAIKLLFQYVIGKPQPAVDPDTLNVQEMRGYMAAAFPPEVLQEMERALPLEHLLQMWPFVLFAKEKVNTEQASEQWAKADERDKRRAERAQQKVERRQRRHEAMQAQSAATNPASPSTNGHIGAQTPSTIGDCGDQTMQTILNWLRRRRDSANGDAQA